MRTMIGRKKLKEEYISIPEAKELLLKRREEGLEENPEEPIFYEARVSIEHAEKFSKLPAEKAKELREKLIGLFEWLDERIATKIVDIMPEDYFDIRVIFAKEEYTPTKEEAEKILEILAEYRE